MIVPARGNELGTRFADLLQRKDCCNREGYDVCRTDFIEGIWDHLTKKLAEPASHAEGLFRHFSEEEVSSFLNAAQLKSERRGAFFFREGDSTDGLHMLTKGRVRLYQSTSAGHHALVRFVEPGEVFGLMGLLPVSNQAMSAQLLEDSEALFWPRDNAARLMEENPKLVANMFALAVRQLDELRERYVYLSTQTAERRVAWALKRLAQRERRKGTTFFVVPRAFGKKDLADMAGTTIYTVSRVLSKWARAGIIVNSHGEILLAQPKTVSQIAKALA